jgi:AcrR family transcriptional regulator
MPDTEAKRRRILRAAETLFCDQGVDRTTLRQVGKAAHAAVGSITHFFGKKPQLAVAVLDDVVSRLAADAERALNGQETTVAGDVRALLSACLKWPQLVPHYRRLIGALQAYISAEGLGTHARLQDRLAKVLAKWAEKRGVASVRGLAGNQLYAVMLAPAMCPGAPTDSEWLDVLGAAALAAVAPPNNAQQHGSKQRKAAAAKDQRRPAPGIQGRQPG